MNPFFTFIHRCRAACALGATIAFSSPVLAQSEQIIRFDDGRDDVAIAMTIDAAGAIIVGGRSDSLSHPVSFAVVKHNAAGATQWVARYQPVADEVFGSAGSVVTDAAGNIYAVGNVGRPVGLLRTDWDWLVVSLNPNGGQRWAHRYNGPGNQFDSAHDVVLDPGGAIYVTGQTSTASGTDWLTTKYSLEGAVLWQRTHSSPGVAQDVPVALRRSADGGVVVLGTTSKSSTEKDLVLVKYDAAGNVVWTQSFSDGAVSDEFPGSLALDAGGNIFVTGITVVSTNPELPNVPFTLKYTGTGSLIFAVKGNTNGGTSIAIGPDGNPVVCGTAIGEAGSFVSPAVSKIDATTGAVLWSASLVTEGEVAVGNDGSVYVGGTRFVGTSSTPFDYFAARFTSGGQPLWTRIVEAGDRATDALLAANGDFFLTGEGPGVRDDMVTVRFSPNFVPPPPPAGPAAPSALSLSPAKSKLTLTWTDNANNETGFKIERSINGGAFVQIAQVGANVRTFTNTGLSKSNFYAYRVRAFNASGHSAFSNTATARPK